jgi:group I intron endonuclease
MIVYRITNKISGKCYIGQTVGPLKDRWKSHQRVNGCTAISRAIQKHGVSSFTIDIIGTYQNQQDLDNAEIYFIDLYNSLSPDGYNLKSGGGAVGKMSEESKLKMSELKKGKVSPRKGTKNSPETRAKLSAALKGKVPWIKGKKHSEETRQKLSDTHKGHIHSEETKKKMSASQKGRVASKETLYKKQRSQKTMTPVVCLNNGITYFSQVEAARQLKVESKNINKVLKGERKHTGGYVFAYVTKK